MKLFFIAFTLICLIAVSEAKNDLKMEGSCVGTRPVGTKIKFTYYSDFDGCKQDINAAIKFSPYPEEQEYLGKRAFRNNQDIYTVENYRLSFKDSTGNNSGIFTYLNEDGQREIVEVDCDVRDYEYGECPTLK